MKAEEVLVEQAMEKDLFFELCGLPHMYIRAALWGGLASGKSTTALKMATGLGEKIAVIDTTGGQIRHLRDLAEFSVLEVPDGSPQRLITCIQKARGFDVLIIDSASAEWVGPGSILEIVETTPPNKEKFSPWRVASPLHNKFMETMLNFNGHLIATFQARHEFVLSEDSNLRLALNPVWKDGTEYLFNFVGYLQRSYDTILLRVEKSLFHSIPYKTYINPGRELGEELRKLSEL